MITKIKMILMFLTVGLVGLISGYKITTEYRKLERVRLMERSVRVQGDCVSYFCV
jgi:hypothetical protein